MSQTQMGPCVLGKKGGLAIKLEEFVDRPLIKVHGLAHRLSHFKLLLFFFVYQCMQLLIDSKISGTYLSFFQKTALKSYHLFDI